MSITVGASVVLISVLMLSGVGVIVGVLVMLDGFSSTVWVSGSISISIFESDEMSVEPILTLSGFERLFSLEIERVSGFWDPQDIDKLNIIINDKSLYIYFLNLTVMEINVEDMDIEAMCSISNSDRVKVNN